MKSDDSDGTGRLKLTEQPVDMTFVIQRLACVRKTDGENTAVVSAKAAAAMGSDPPDHESILETVKLLQARSIQQDSKLDLL